VEAAVSQKRQSNQLSRALGQELLRQKLSLNEPLLPATLKAWPKWRLLAAVVAFAIWGVAIPNSMIASKLLRLVFGLLALLVSTIFSYAEKIFAPDTNNGSGDAGKSKGEGT
jgi:hypothetical protein